MRIKVLKLLNVAASIGLLFAAAIYVEQTQAAEVNLAWDASTSPGVTGHKIGIGKTEALEERTLLVANVTTATVIDLQPATTYFFGVKAYNPETESAWSNIVSAVIPPAPAPPTLFSVKSPLGIKVTFSPKWVTGTTKIAYAFTGGNPATSTRTTNGASSTVWPGPGKYMVTVTRTTNGVEVTEAKTVVLTGAEYAFK